MDASQITFTSTAVWTAAVAIIGLLSAIVGGMVTLAWRTSRFVTLVEAGRETLRAEVKQYLSEAESATSKALLDMSKTLDLMMNRINEQHHALTRLMDRVDDHHERIATLRRDVDVGHASNVRRSVPPGVIE